MRGSAKAMMAQMMNMESKTASMVRMWQKVGLRSMFRDRGIELPTKLHEVLQ